MAGERGYLAYLVRLWAVHHDGDLVWRASAENAHTGERRVFADVASLCVFLRESVGQPAGSESCDGEEQACERGLKE